MIRLAADEDLDEHIVRGLRHRLEDLDIVGVREVGLASTPDPDILEWAARERRVLVSHDASTMTAAAYSRVARAEFMPGVIIIPQWLNVGTAIEDLVLVVECCDSSDLEGRVQFLPLA